SLYTGEDKSCSIGYSEDNKAFNRFKNITVYDDNRITLITNPNLDMCQREYINANYVHECCYQYWRESDIIQYEEYFVKCLSSKDCNGYIERKFAVQLEKSSSSWNVLQFQVTNWPTDGVIREPRTVLQVIDEVIHRQQKIGGGPVVVHCSDTVSRSGVYCSVSIALEQCKAEGVVDVFQVTKSVRRSKPGAVTTLDQYSSIYESFYPGLPKTRSGKIMRRILIKIANNLYEELGDVSTLANPPVVNDIMQKWLKEAAATQSEQTEQ
uniref:Protein-tyrosine-phosphatase n=1 Tax=Amphimedon queenslandica TaxID=400682 RepID=A0A1X7V052_AMPQE